MYFSYHSACLHLKNLPNILILDVEDIILGYILIHRILTKNISIFDISKRLTALPRIQQIPS